MAGKEWFVWEKIRKIHPMQCFDSFTFWSQLPDGMSFDVGAKYENKDVELVSPEKQFFNAGRVIAKKIKSDPGWFAEKLDLMDETTGRYFVVSGKTLATDLAKKTNSELSRTFREMHDAYFASHSSAGFTIPPEFQTEYISRFVLEHLEKKIKEKKISADLGTAFNLLSQPEKESILVEEKREFLALLDKLLANKNLAAFFKEKTVAEIEKSLAAIDPVFDSILTAHWKRFEWIFFMYEGPALERVFFVNQLKENLARGMYIAKELEQNKKILAEKHALIEKISDNETDRIIFSFTSRLVETKATRKDAMYFGSFVFEKLFSEIAKRIGATLDNVRYMARDELFSALEGKFSDFKLLDERLKCSVFFAVNGKRILLVGKEAKNWFSENVKKEKVSKSSTLKGMSAFPGVVEGRVKVINHPNEMIKMNSGDIMVSHSTNPNLLPAMTKAAAIITDVGGITCHAAIVSREFRIPCVVGTKFATQVLKDGDLVEVDATKGIIRIIKNSESK